MTVSGVAFATVISNLVALVLALIKLAKNKDYCKIEFKNLRLRKEETFEIIKIGVPSCIIGISFYFGEVVVISAVNSISENAMTANAISSQIDRINYTVGSSIATAVGIMISQNFGANQFDRIKKIMRIGVTYNILVTTGVGLVMLALSGVFFNLLTDSQAVIELAKGRLVIITLTNFVTTTMEVYSNAVRALKRPRYLLIVGIICGLIIRSCWTWFVWPLCKTFPFLFACLPISTLVGTIIYLFVYSKTLKYEENNAKTAMLI
jgi:Na+-driven multidrug efflux pump